MPSANDPQQGKTAPLDMRQLRHALVEREYELALLQEGRENERLERAIRRGEWLMGLLPGFLFLALGRLPDLTRETPLCPRILVIALASLGVLLVCRAVVILWPGVFPRKRGLACVSLGSLDASGGLTKLEWVEESLDHARSAEERAQRLFSDLDEQHAAQRVVSESIVRQVKYNRAQTNERYNAMREAMVPALLGGLCLVASYVFAAWIAMLSGT